LAEVVRKTAPTYLNFRKNFMQIWQGKTALITGASYGIGTAFARRLAAEGAHLVLTARSTERLQTLADELRSQYQTRVTIIAADLNDANAPQSIFAETQRQQLAIDLLINNAGVGAVGDFASQSLDKQLEMIQVNVTALVALTHLYLPGMLARRHGHILNVASTASFQGVPYLATYAATKSFILNFSEGLWAECKPYGVTVTALCPGSTESNFHAVAGSERSNHPKQSAEAVVSAGLQALAQGRSHVVSGWNNKLMVWMERFVPRQTVTGMAAKIFQEFAGKKPNN
jgi:uncharacterized protein